MYGVIDFSDEIPLRLREEALKEKVLIVYEDGEFKLKGKDYKPKADLPEIFDMNFVHTSYRFKPEDLFISEIKWKFLMRNVVKGKNIMMTGAAGSGKCLEKDTKVKLMVSEKIFNEINSHKI